MAKDKEEKGKGWLWLGLGLLAGAGVAGGAYAWKKASERFNPVTEGSLNLSGLQSAVTVTRDRWGVPHIYAENEHDLFFAQGFIQAQDRFWQMELNRRAALGQLSSLVGREGFALDRLTHTTGLPECAEQDLATLDEDSAKVLEAFTQGVNAFIEQKRYPVEFSILRHEPSLWRPLDTMAFGKLFAWAMSGNYQAEMIRARLLGKLGSRLASKLEPVYPKDHPLIYPQGARYDGVAETILTSYERFSFVPMLAVGGASNNWVVSGNLTESGDPLLANDPHLALQNPSLWYAMHLSCPTFEATGVTMPGGPFIAIGHNRHIAWGATLAMLDVQDLFIEQFHVEKPRQYLRDGEWKEAKVRDIEIEIKGETPYLEEVLVTEHGPVLADLPVEGAKNETAHYKLALQWVGHQPMNIVSGFLALNRASNWQEFRKAVSKWTLPCLNLVYADVEGNIGYQLTGKVPIRKTGGGIVPTPGWDSNNDWQGFVPFDELPSIFNPPEGFIVTANNKIVDDNFPYHLGSDYITGYRADRIRDLLKACPKVSIEDCRRIQADCVTIAGQQFAKLLIKKICREDLTPQAIRALKEFERWSGDASADSIGETIYQVTFNYLMEELFIDLLGEDARSYLGESHNGLIAEINSFSGRIVPHLLKMIEKDDISLLEESSHPQSWQTMLQRAFEHAAASLSRKFGSDPKRWKWGRLHTAELKHPLGSVKALRPFFNRGPFPVGGDAETPAQTAFLPMPSVKCGFEVNSRATSYRQIIDLGNFDRSMMVYPGGQSGSPFSKHYDDLIKPWQNSQLVPMPFSSIMVEKYSESKVQLLPNRNILRLVVDQQSSEIAEEKVEFKETDIE